MTEVKTETFVKQTAGKLELDKAVAETTIHSTVATYEASGLAANDTVVLFRVPVGARIFNVRLLTDKLGTGTTADVGDAEDGDRYIDGANTAATAGCSVVCGIDGIGYKVEKGNEDIILKNLGGSATGTIKAIVEYAE